MVKKFVVAAFATLAALSTTATPASAATTAKAALRATALTAPVYKGYQTRQLTVSFTNVGGASGWIGDFKKGSNAIQMAPVYVPARSSLRGPMAVPCGRYSYTMQFFEVNVYGRKLSSTPVGSVYVRAC